MPVGLTFNNIYAQSTCDAWVEKRAGRAWDSL